LEEPVAVGLDADVQVHEADFFSRIVARVWRSTKDSADNLVVEVNNPSSPGRRHIRDAE
jgi:hypothetical protein